MKHLTDYTQEAQTKLFDECGAFFAFGSEQFKEKRVEGVSYYDMGAGLICPKENAEKLTKGLDSIQAAGVKKDIKENGITKIIWREFANYECQIVYDYTDAKDALIDYGITEEQIEAEFKKYMSHCIEHDLF